MGVVRVLRPGDLVEFTIEFQSPVAASARGGGVIVYRIRCHGFYAVQVRLATLNFIAICARSSVPT